MKKVFRVIDRTAGHAPIYRYYKSYDRAACKAESLNVGHSLSESSFHYFSDSLGWIDFSSRLDVQLLISDVTKEVVE